VRLWRSRPAAADAPAADAPAVRPAAPPMVWTAAEDETGVVDLAAVRAGAAVLAGTTAGVAGPLATGAAAVRAASGGPGSSRAASSGAGSSGAGTDAVRGPAQTEGPAAGAGWPDGGQGAARSADTGSPAARDDPARSRSGAGSGPKPAGRARRRDPWRTAFFGALALAIAGGAAWALLGSSLLVVRHEEVTGNRLVTAGTVLEAAGIRPGTPLASVNTNAAAHRIEQIAQVRSARVTRSFPDTVLITVRERTPALAVAGSGGYALIDGSGVTIRWSARKPAGLPVLRQPPAQLRGNPGVRAAVAVLARLPQHLRKLVVAVTAPSPAAVTIALRNGVTVIWGSPVKDALKAAEVTVLLRTHARYLDVSDPATAVTHQ
jgi:cell division protein FtsQ